MDAQAALLARMEAQRASWVELPDGRKVRIVRPEWEDLQKIIFGDGNITIEHAKRYVIGWSGFSEATLFGPSRGSSDELPFYKDVWAAYIADHVDEAQAVIEAISDRSLEFIKQRADVAKNSLASSTTGQPAASST